MIIILLLFCLIFTLTFKFERVNSCFSLMKILLHPLLSRIFFPSNQNKQLILLEATSNKLFQFWTVVTSLHQFINGQDLLCQ